ncbi:mxaL protein [Paraburkholderia caballeronis]|uniref:MxaL protein n=1 Tax=Paraburkholderia caballeronis TaxID=416943 RepID=UPI0010D0D2D2|nr:mxaL protein [Paraburkholderia caballeronis]
MSLPSTNKTPVARAFAAARRWSVAAALPFIAAALWMPPLHLPRDTFSYIATFDVTQSMDTDDVSLDGAPASRLAFAKASMRDALGRLPCGSKVGWSVFAGERTLLLLPPIEVCANYDALLSSLAAIDGRMRWTNWSRIAEGGVWSAVRTARQVGPGVAVLFFTDGQEAPPLLPSNQRPWTEGHVVKGWLIGVGGTEPVPMPKSDANGNRIGFWRADDVIQVPRVPGEPAAGESHEELSSLRGPYLAATAARVGFSYRRLTDAASLGDALTDPRFGHREPVPVDVRALPACIALLLLVWRYLPERATWRTAARAFRRPFQRPAPRGTTAGGANTPYSRSR